MPDVVEMLAVIASNQVLRDQILFSYYTKSFEDIVQNEEEPGVTAETSFRKDRLSEADKKAELADKFRRRIRRLKLRIDLEKRKLDPYTGTFFNSEAGINYTICAIIAVHGTILMMFGTVMTDSAIDYASMSFNLAYVLETCGRIYIFKQHHLAHPGTPLLQSACTLTRLFVRFRILSGRVPLNCPQLQLCHARKRHNGQPRI